MLDKINKTAVTGSFRSNKASTPVNTFTSKPEYASELVPQFLVSTEKVADLSQVPVPISPASNIQHHIFVLPCASTMRSISCAVQSVLIPQVAFISVFHLLSKNRDKGPMVLVVQPLLKEVGLTRSQDP